MTVIKSHLVALWRSMHETRNVHNEIQFVMCMYNHMALKVAMVMRTRKSLKCALILLFTFE